MINPCIQCGECCQNEVCFLPSLFGDDSLQTPCVWLFPAGGRLWCKFQYFSMFVDGVGKDPLREAIGTGKGCRANGLPIFLGGGIAV